MSVSCDISWENFASLLQQFHTASSVLFVESTLDEPDLSTFSSGRISQVLVEPKAVVFTLNSGQSKRFEFANAQFRLTLGVTGRWELLAVILGEGRVSFTAKGESVDGPSPMAPPQSA